MSLQADLQRLSGTTLDAQGAANAWAGTTGLSLVGALNAKAGTTGQGLVKVLNTLAGTTGKDAGAAAAAISGVTATTYTIFAKTLATNSALTSFNTDYATARTGGGVLAFDSQGLSLGQVFWTPNYFCNEAFVAFDTSSVVGTITSATLSLYGKSNTEVGVAFTIEARLHDWGATLATADWVAGADLASKTLLASVASSSYAAAYVPLTSEAAFVSSINQAGETRILLNGSRHRTGNAPAGSPSDYIIFHGPEASGTTQDPKLVIVAEA